MSARIIVPPGRQRRSAAGRGSHCRANTVVIVRPSLRAIGASLRPFQEQAAQLAEMITARHSRILVLRPCARHQTMGVVFLKAADRFHCPADCFGDRLGGFLLAPKCARADPVKGQANIRQMGTQPTRLLPAQIG